jgi:hypothetical protein
MHKISYFYIQWYSVCPNITPKFCTITILNSFVKEHNDSKLVGMCVALYFSKLHLSKCNDSLVVSIKQNMNFNFLLPPCSYILYHKKNLIINCLSLENLSAYKSHGPTLTGHVLHPPQKSECPIILAW